MALPLALPFSLPPTRLAADFGVGDDFGMGLGETEPTASSSGEGEVWSCGKVAMAGRFDFGEWAGGEVAAMTGAGATAVGMIAVLGEVVIGRAEAEGGSGIRGEGGGGSDG